MTSPEERIVELGLTLPEVAAPVAAYVPTVRTGDYVYTSGQLPFSEGSLPATGKVGADVTPESAQELAALCALNGIAAVRAEIGDLSRVVRVATICSSPTAKACVTWIARRCRCRSGRNSSTTSSKVRRWHKIRTARCSPRSWC